jgi:hypothetical protein
VPYESDPLNVVPLLEEAERELARVSGTPAAWGAWNHRMSLWRVKTAQDQGVHYVYRVSLISSDPSSSERVRDQICTCGLLVTRDNLVYPDPEADVLAAFGHLDHRDRTRSPTVTSRLVTKIWHGQDHVTYLAACQDCGWRSMRMTPVAAHALLSLHQHPLLE